MQAKLSRRGVVSGIAVAPVLPATLMQKESRTPSLSHSASNSPTWSSCSMKKVW